MSEILQERERERERERREMMTTYFSDLFLDKRRPLCHHVFSKCCMPLYVKHGIWNALYTISNLLQLQRNKETSQCC